MASSTVARLAGATAVAFVLATLAVAVPVAAQSDQKITICQATGSTSNPWVFTTIDAHDLPEHLARGDYPASSIADCPGASASGAATPATTPASAASGQPMPTPNPPGAAAGAGVPGAAAAPPAPTPVPVQQQQAAGGGGLPNASGPGLAGAAAATPVATTAPANPAVNTAGAQATPEPDVSTLPRSGGEPDHEPLVVALLGTLVAGFVLRRLGREPA